MDISRIGSNNIWIIPVEGSVKFTDTEGTEPLPIISSFGLFNSFSKLPPQTSTNLNSGR